MLVTLKSILKLADARKIAVGAFNITSLEGIQAVLGAAEELEQPAILQYAPAHGNIISLSVIGPVMVMMAERSPGPVCVHLDHCDAFSDLKEALDLGFTSVMYDGSALSFEENCANTVIAVEAASGYGASVEGEIGALGREEFVSVGEKEGTAVCGSYTEPEQAGAFVEQTGIDALACSFGTVHGLYLSKPNLDFARIKRIRESIGIPIVMHGGSGVSDTDFKKCIANGVRKINYYTYLVKAGGEAVRNACEKAGKNVFFHDVTLWGIQAMKADVLHAIQVFSNLQ